MSIYFGQPGTSREREILRPMPVDELLYAIQEQEEIPSVNKLAERIGTSRQNVCKWLNKPNTITMRNYLRVADCYWEGVRESKES